MKKDGIQTRNRKLATKAKKRRPGMHDFFKPFDSRFSAMYSSMGSSYLAAAAATSPMSQYYAGQMSAMQPFMGAPNTPSTAAAAASVVSPLGQTAASPLMPTVSTPSLSNTSTSSPSPSMGHVSSTAESVAAVAAAASFSPYLTGNPAAAATAMPVVGASA